MKFRSQEYHDVRTFMSKMGYALPTSPVFDRKFLDDDERIAKIREEVVEIEEAIRREDLADIADGIVDLIYFVLGLAAAFGLPWEELWQEVQRANMEKQPGSTERAKLDAVKPEGWEPPKIESILRRYGWIGVVAAPLKKTPKDVERIGQDPNDFDLKGPFS
jgi:predicted HAD superfamily Cof-like phosphohydrolase